MYIFRCTVTKKFENKIAHAEFKSDEIEFYASDGFEDQEITVGDNTGMTIMFDDTDEQKIVFDKLKVGGIVTMDFFETSADSTPATLIDKYGIHWYLNYNH